MPTVIAHHDVKDVEHWLAPPRREEFFRPLGVRNIRTFVNPQNPNRVALVTDVPDMDPVMAAMETEAASKGRKGLAQTIDRSSPGRSRVRQVRQCPRPKLGP